MLREALPFAVAEILKTLKLFTLMVLLTPSLGRKFVFLLVFLQQHQEEFSLSLADLEAHCSLCLIEGCTYLITLEYMVVEGLRKRDGCIIEDVSI